MFQERAASEIYNVFSLQIYWIFSSLQGSQSRGAASNVGKSAKSAGKDTADSAQDAAQKASRKADTTAEDAKAKASSASNIASEKASEAKSAAQSKASQLQKNAEPALQKVDSSSLSSSINRRKTARALISHQWFDVECVTTEWDPPCQQSWLGRRKKRLHSTGWS